MRELVLATYGPVPVLRELLSEVPEVESAWVERRSGAR